MRLGRSLLLAMLTLAGRPAFAGLGVSWRFEGSSGIASNGSAYNNIAARSGTQCAFIQVRGAFEQSFEVATAGTYTVSFWASPRSWPTVSHDFDVIMDGKSLGRVGPTQLSANSWRNLSFPSELAAGRHTLRFRGLNTKGGDFTSFVEDVRVASAAGGVPLRNPGFDDVKLEAGSFAMRPPEKTQPLFRFEGRVTTSGKAISGRVLRIAGGGYMPLEAITTMPTVKVNGLDVGSPTTLVNTGEHEGFVLFLPRGVKVERDDTLTLSAPQAWATVKNDFCEAMDNQPIEVCTGRSFVGTEAMRPTLSIGVNYGHLVTPFWGTFSLQKNLRFRIQRWDNGVIGSDARGFPTSMNAETADATFIADNNLNGIDNTGTPAPEGLYAVGWGRSSPVECSIVSQDADVTERGDMANRGDAKGQGLVRVFNVKRKRGAVRTNFGLALRIRDRTRKPRLNYLAIYGPGDFERRANTPTVLEDVDDPAAPSSTFLARTKGGIGSARFGDGFIDFDNASDVCEPEHLMPEDRFAWSGWARNWRVNYVEARPWTEGQSPFVYSPLFGEPFGATLGQPMATSRPGAVETIEVSDAATAPVFEGLVLRAGDERMRVLSVSGTGVKVERGSESTTPAAHDAGPISVSNRLPLKSLASFASQDSQVVELVTKGPHHLRTGNHPTFEGEGWGPWAFTDGSKANAGATLRYYSIGILVTGPDTVVVVGGRAATKANVTLAAPVRLDPARCYSDIHLPSDFGMPYAVAARFAAVRGSDLHLNLPFAASDSLVDAIARIVRENYPPGRRVYLEYINEPWNWAYVTSKTQAKFGWLLGKVPEGGMLWQVRRTGQIHRRFAAAFAEHDRRAEVRSILNMQLGSAWAVRGIVKQALDEGLPPPDIAIAPYVDFGNQPSLVKALNIAELDQAVDLWIWNLVYGRVPDKTGTVPWCEAQRKAVDAVNKEFGTSVELYGYEGGAGTAWPQVTTKLTRPAAAGDATLHVADASLYSPGQFLRVGPEWVRVRGINGNVLAVDRARAGTAARANKAGAEVRNSYFESSHDLTYQPNFRIAEFDQFGLWQKYFDRMTMNGYSMHWNNGYHQWCLYHWLGQLPGRGDGSDGKFDNRNCLATPGREGSKGPNENQDLKAVSVRGQALIDWNRCVRPK